MLEDKIGHQRKKIESNELRVRLDPIEYDVGIKTGNLLGEKAYECTMSLII